jgi:uncharacterized phosphosugar-binding protein
MTSYALRWIEEAKIALDNLVKKSSAAMETASEWCANAIESDGLVHMFGSGHSRIPVEEMFPRYGSFPGFHPLVELSLTFHTQIAGSNGQRQALFIERTSGLAEQILQNFRFKPHDVLMCFSVSGSNAVPVEMVQGARDRGVRTIAVTSVARGGEMAGAADLVIDLPVPMGDAAITIDGLDTPVGPLSTFLYAAVVNEIKVRTAARLVEVGHPPAVITSASVVGEKRSNELFESAYLEHARRASQALRVAGLN